MDNIYTYIDVYMLYVRAYERVCVAFPDCSFKICNYSIKIIALKKFFK